MSSDHHSRRRTRTPHLPILVIFAITAVMATACGHRRGPTPPPSKIPQTPVIQVHQRGQEAILSFPYPTTTISGTLLSGVSRIEVWRFAQEVPEFAIELLEEERLQRKQAQALLDELGLTLWEAPAVPAIDPVTGLPSTTPATAPAGTEPLTEAAAEPGEEVTEPSVGSLTEDTETPTSETQETEDDAAMGEAQPEEAEEDEGSAEDGEGDVEPTEGSGSDVDEAEPELSEEEQLQLEIDAARNLLRSPPTPKSSFITATTRDFKRQAELALSVDSSDIASTVVGDSIVFRLALPPRHEEGPEIGYLFAVEISPDKGKPSDRSATVAVLPSATPSPPKDVTVVAQSYGVQINWTAEEDPPGGFRIYRREAQSRVYGEPVGSLPGTGRQFFDRQAVFGARYIYGVTAVDTLAPLLESDISSEHEIDYEDDFGPIRPGGLVAFPEAGRVRLLWTAVPADDLAGYEILRRASAEEAVEKLNSELTERGQYLDEGLRSGETWLYSVVAVDERGNRSEASLEIEVRVP